MGVSGSSDKRRPDVPVWRTRPEVQAGVAWAITSLAGAVAAEQCTAVVGDFCGLRSAEAWSRRVTMDEEAAAFASVSHSHALVLHATRQLKDLLQLVRTGEGGAAGARARAALRRMRKHREYEVYLFASVLRDLEYHDERALNLLQRESDPQSPCAMSPHSPQAEDTAEAVEAVIRAVTETRTLPTEKQAGAVLRAAAKAVEAMPTLVHITVPEGGRLAVVGDLHGQLEDLLLILERIGPITPENTVLFNGDFVDRGPCGCEVVLLLCALLLQYPGCVFLNRGNHEDANINMSPCGGFFAEVVGASSEKGKYNLAVWRRFQALFDRLSLMHVVNDEVAVTHAGLPMRRGTKLRDIQELKRPLRVATVLDTLRASAAKRRDLELVHGLLWSDPKEPSQMQSQQYSSEASQRGLGCHFSIAHTLDFLSSNGLKRLIRSHEVFGSGYKLHHVHESTRVPLTTTVFSASNYANGRHANQGCFLFAELLDGCLEFSFEQFRAGVRRQQSCPHSGPQCAKEEVLQRLRHRVFSARGDLLRAFQGVDVARTGRVTRLQWVRVMRSCVARELPWHSLCPFLTLEEADGIAYTAHFLERFQHRLARQSARKWVEVVLPHTKHRMRSVLPRLRAEAVQRGKVSFQHLCDAFRVCVPGLSERAAYYLVVCVDRTHDGFWNSAELDAVFGNGDDAATAPGLLDIWAEEREVRKGLHTVSGQGDDKKLREFYGALAGGLSAEAFADVALRTFDPSRATDREGWLLTARYLGEPVSADRLHAAVKEMTRSWERVSLILDVLDTIGRAHMHLEQTFAALDSQHTGVLTPEELRAGLEVIYAGSGRTAEHDAKLLWEILDEKHTGELTIAGFVSALEVRDVWTEVT